MNDQENTKACPVCGGSMRQVANVQNKFGKAQRFRCTCGHFEDIPGNFIASPIKSEPSVSSVPEGFQEFPEKTPAFPG